jgi:2-oxo-3-hexenedioate decarboxylase
MTLAQADIEKLAEHLEKAELDAYEVTKITDDYPEMTMSEATDIQWEIRRRKEERGHKIVGMKMDLTSWAKMKQMGVEKPCYGFLADYFSLADGAEVHIDELINPKVEAEVAFVTNKDLSGASVTVDEVLSATEFVVPAIEIIDSRYKDFKFDLVSVQADNSSSARYVVGSRAAKPEDFDWSTIGVVMQKNGKIVELGAGAAVLDHPAASVAMLASMLQERNEIIPAGTFVMTGGITAAVLVERGDSIVVRYQDLGSVSLSFV